MELIAGIDHVGRVTYRLIRVKIHIIDARINAGCRKENFVSRQLRT